MAVMGGDDIIVGGNPSIRGPSQAQAQAQVQAQASDRSRVDRQDKRRAALCGAMSQQRDDSGAQSMPQKLVQLVGCRDPKMRPSRKR
jgi:hypothetical protein